MDEPSIAERERVVTLLESEKSMALRNASKLMLAHDLEQADTYTSYAAHIQRILDLIKGRV